MNKNLSIPEKNYILEAVVFQNVKTKFSLQEVLVVFHHAGNKKFLLWFLKGLKSVLGGVLCLNCAVFDPKG